MRRAREDFLTLLCAQQKVNTKRHPNFLRMELTQKIVTLDSPLQAISLRFRGDLSKVNYIEAYNKLGQEMTRQGVSYEKSSYFLCLPIGPIGLRRHKHRPHSGVPCGRMHNITRGCTHGSPR